MSVITQAVVLVGGKASRLRRSGTPVDISKAFLQFKQKPLLYWNLYILHKAGIRRLIIAGSTVEQLNGANRIIKGLPVAFNQILFFQDEGVGVHGLLYELRYMLDEEVLFECGHSLSFPAHYRRLMWAKQPHTVVFSAYKPHPANLRQPVSLDAGKVVYDQRRGKYAVAHPIVADKVYAKNLASLGFNIDRILRTMCNSDRLTYIENDTPPEFDVELEIGPAMQAYGNILASLAII